MARLNYNEYDFEWAEGFDEILKKLGGTPPNDDEVFDFMCETKIDIPSNAYYEIVLNQIVNLAEDKYKYNDFSYYVNARDTNLYVNDEPVNGWEDFNGALIEDDAYAKGGKVNVKIKDWYKKNYPTDDLGEELNDTNTFEDVENALNKGDDVYEVFGVGDSIIRERLFQHLAKIKGVSYGFIYEKWLSEGMLTDEEIKSKLSKQGYAKGGNLPKVDGKEYIRVSYYGGSGPYPYTEWLEDRIGDNLYKGTPYSPGALQRVKKELKNKGFNIKNEVRKLEDRPLTEEEKKQRYYDKRQEYYSLLRKLINFRNQNYAKGGVTKPRLKKGDVVELNARKWQDSNGNTYHNVQVYVNDDYIGSSGEEYGYGTQYESTANKMLFDKYKPPYGYDPSNNPIYMLKDKGIRVISNGDYVNRKRDMLNFAKGGYLKKVKVPKNSPFWKMTENELKKEIIDAYFYKKRFSMHKANNKKSIENNRNFDWKERSKRVREDAAWWDRERKEVNDKLKQLRKVHMEKFGVVDYIPSGVTGASRGREYYWLAKGGKLEPNPYDKYLHDNPYDQYLQARGGKLKKKEDNTALLAAGGIGGILLGIFLGR